MQNGSVPNQDVKESAINLRVNCQMSAETALTITCHFCFNEIEVDLEIDQSFEGSNTEIYDCTVCCNPNKLQYTVTHGSLVDVLVSDGNE